MSPDNLYLRLFGFGRRAADEVSQRLCRGPGPNHAVLGTWLGGDLVEVASYVPTDDPGTAEIAVAVADGMHHRGVGTLLLEHLASLARRRGVGGRDRRQPPPNDRQCRRRTTPVTKSARRPVGDRLKHPRRGPWALPGADAVRTVSEHGT